MIQPRLTPCLLIKNGMLVRSQLFKVHQAIGNPISTIMRFSDWNIDELVVLDISTEDFHDLRRDDLQIQYDGTSFLALIEQISQVAFMPLAVGGRIRTVDDFQQRLSRGADKCIINTQALREPDLITRAAQRFGSQCVVVSIDAKQGDEGYEVWIDGGRERSDWNPVDWAREAERLGAGEIFLNSIDRDGSGQGYDLALVESVCAAVSIPVIVCGGVGDYSHFPAGITAGASAVSAANIFHFFELSYAFAKQACLDAGQNLRPSRLSSPWLRREPVYDTQRRDALIAARLEAARTGETKPPRENKVKWCTRCVYPAISAAPMEFDEQGVCMGCRMGEVKSAIPQSEWARRKELLRELLEKYRCRDGSRYDCVIPVSGGKDSYFQTHVITREFGLRPLLVTYNGNNYLDVGWRNVHRMKEAFGVDHVFYSPSVELLVKLNRLGFIIMGDMNWHAHVGITTLPIRVAAQAGVPLLIWGEHGYLDLCGQFSMDDFPEMSYRDRLEHFARGYEWNYMVGLEGITAQDMIPYQYPSDQTLFDLDVRGLYLGNYLYWEANEHTRMVVEQYGFGVNHEPFERTYRTMSNLDDMHENGMHDYLKYIKFGYGRCTDHVCKDIRAGLMSRDEGIARVRAMDHVKSRDLQRWLSYTGMSEADFDAIADTFRDPRVWRKEDGVWVKDNIWD